MKKIALFIESSRAFGRELIQGISAFAQTKRDWTLRQFAIDETDLPERLSDFSGVIARIPDADMAQRLAEIDIPLVDVYGQHHVPGGTQVESGHVEIGRLAREFFLSRGFSNLAFCGIPGAAFSETRERAFADDATHVYRPDGDPPDYNSKFYDENADFIPDAAQLRHWISALPKPAAVFCCNDLRAIHVQRAVLDLGLKVPDEIAILGVDNDTTLCAFAEVPVSSIDPRAYHVGYTAAETLCDIMENPDADVRGRSLVVSPGAIAERASTEFIPVEPAWFGAALMHIEKHVHEPVSASNIFSLAGRSGTYVEKFFRKRTGQSVQTYITAVKMREARRLLSDPALRISEIAYRCGFSTPHYFNRVFHATYGMSPKAFRKSLTYAP